MIDRSVTSTVVLAICALGSLGNVMSVGVWALKKRKTAGERFLLLLSISDVCSLLTISGREISLLLNNTCCEALFLNVNMVPRVFSDLLAITIAVQRCVAVRRPFSATLLCRRPRQNAFVAFLFLLALIQACTIGFVYYLPFITSNCRTGNIIYLAPKETRELSVTVAAGVNMTISFLYLLILIASNVILLMSLKKAAQFQGHTGPQVHEQAAVNVTRLVMCMCSLSVLAIVISNVNDMYWTLHPSSSDADSQWEVVTFAMEVLLALNQSSNFLFYACFLNSFRSGLRRCCCGDDVGFGDLASRDVTIVSQEITASSCLAGAPPMPNDLT